MGCFFFVHNHSATPSKRDVVSAIAVEILWSQARLSHLMLGYLDFLILCLCQPPKPFQVIGFVAPQHGHALRTSALLSHSLGDYRIEPVIEEVLEARLWKVVGEKVEGSAHR